MKKEVVIAIILGVCIGLIITFGVHRARQSLQTKNIANSTSQPTNPSASPKDSNPHSLILYSPEDSQIYDHDEIQVSGITSENAMIAVIRDSEYASTYADSQGSFATTITLKPGANRIIVHSHNLEGTLATASADVVYSTADLTSTNDSQTPKADDEE